MNLLENLHFCTDDKLHPLADAVVVGIHDLTSDQNRLRMHVVLGSYVWDNPESEDLLGLKRGNRTNSPCYRCLLSRLYINGCKLETVRTLGATLKILEVHN